MYRFVLLCAAVTTATSYQTAASDEPGKFKLGVSFKGEVSGTRTTSKGLAVYVGGSAESHQAEIPVALKAGQDIAITCTVVGKGRHVVLVLRDPKGVQIGITKSAVKTNTLKVEEVNADGVYKIQVLTSLTGPFTLRATASSEEEVDALALEAEIKELKALLAQKEAKLKALKKP